MKKNTLKKIIFGSSNIIVIGTVAFVSSYTEVKNNNNDNNFLKESSTILTKNMELDDENLAVNSTRLRRASIDAAVTIDALKKAFENAVTKFVSFPTSENFTLLETSRSDLDQKYKESDSRTAEEKKLNADFNQVINQFNYVVSQWNTYKNNLSNSLPAYINLNFKNISNGTTSITADKTSTAFEKGILSTITKKTDVINKSALAVKSLENYLIALSKETKDNAEKEIGEFSKLAEVSVADSEEKKLLTIINAVKTFADTVYNLNLKFVNSDSTTEFDWDTFNKDLDSATAEFTTLSSNDSVTGNSAGKILLKKTQLSFEEIKSKFNLTKALAQHVFSLDNNSKKSFDDLMISSRENLEKITKEWTTLANVDEANTNDFLSSIKNNVSAVVFNAYSLAAEKTIEANILYAQYSVSPLPELKKRFAKLIDTAELFNNRAKLLALETLKIKEPSTQISKSFSEYIDEFKKKYPDDTVFGNSTLIQYNSILRNLQTQRHKFVKQLSEQTTSSTTITDASASVPNWDLDLASWSLNKFDNLLLSSSKSFESINKILTLANSSINIRIKTFDELNAYSLLQKKFVSEVAEVGERLIYNKNRLTTATYIANSNPKLILEATQQINNLETNSNRSKEQEKELTNLKTQVFTLNRDLEKAKEDIVALNRIVESQIRDLQAVLDKPLEPQPLISLSDSNKQFLDTTTAIEKEFEKIKLTGVNPDSRFTRSISLAITNFGMLKSLLSNYYLDTHLFVSEDRLKIKSIEHYYLILKSEPQSSFPKVSFEIIEPVFSKLISEVNLYDTFSMAAINSTDASIAAALEFVRKNTNNQKYMNLVEEFFKFNSMRSNINLNTISSQNSEVIKKFENFKNAANQMLLDASPFFSNMLLFIKDSIALTEVEIIKNKFEILNQVNKFLDNKNYNVKTLTESKVDLENLLSPSSKGRKIAFLNTHLEGLSNLVESLELLTNTANNGNGDKIRKLITKSNHDATSVTVDEVIKLKTDILISGNEKPWSIKLKNIMLEILDFIDSKRIINALLNDLNSAFNFDSSLSKLSIKTPGIFLEKLNAMLFENNNNNLEVHNKVLNEIFPDFQTDLKKALDERKRLSQIDNVNYIENHNKHGYKMIFEDIDSILDKQILSKEQFTDLKTFLQRAKEQIENFQREVIDSLSPEDKQKYNSAIANAPLFLAKLNEDIKKKERFDIELLFLRNKLNSFLSKKEIETMNLLKDESLAVKQNFNNALKDFETNFANLQAFIDNNSSSILTSEQQTKLNELKKMQTTSENLIKTNQDNLKVNNDEINSLLEEAKNATFSRDEIGVYRNTIIQISNLNLQISQTISDLTTVDELLKSLNKIAQNNLTNEQKENLVIFNLQKKSHETKLQILQNDLIKLNTEFEELNQKIITKFTSAQKTEHLNLLQKKTDFLTALEKAKNDNKNEATQINQLEKIVVEELVKQEVNKQKYQQLKNNFDDAKTKLDEAKNSIKTNQTKQEHINLLLTIIFTKEELKKYDDAQPQETNFADKISTVRENIAKNNLILTELETLKNTKINEVSDEKIKNSLLASINLIKVEKTAVYDTKSSILSAELELFYLFVSKTVEWNNNSITTILPELIQEIEKELKNPPSFLQNLPESVTIQWKEFVLNNISNIHKKISEIKVSNEKYTAILKRILPIVVSGQKTSDYYKLLIEKNIQEIDKINNNVKDGMRFSIKDSAVNVLNTYIGEVKNNLNQFTWANNHLEKYENIINIFKTKNEVDKAFVKFQENSNLENQNSLNFLKTEFSKLLLEFKNSKFHEVSLSQVIEKINSFANIVEIEESIKKPAKDFFTNPTLENQKLFAEALNKIKDYVVAAQEKLEQAKALLDSDTEKAVKVAEATEFLNDVSKIQNEVDQYPLYEGISSSILEFSKNFENLTNQQIENSISKFKEHQNTFRDEMSNYALLTVRNWVDISIQNLKGRSANRSLTFEVERLGKDFASDSSVDTFKKFYDNFINSKSNHYVPIKDQIMLVNKAVYSYNLSTYKISESITSSILQVNEAKKSLTEFLSNSNVSTKDSDFIKASVLTLDNLLNNLNNTKSSSASANANLLASLELYADYPALINLKPLATNITKAHESRIPTTNIDLLLEITKEVDQLEAFAKSFVDVSLRDMIPQLSTKINKIKQKIENNDDFDITDNGTTLILNSLESRIKNVEIDYQILNGDADSRALNRVLDEQIAAIEPQKITKDSLVNITKQINEYVANNQQQKQAKNALNQKLQKTINEIEARDLIFAITQTQSQREIGILEEKVNNAFETYKPVVNTLNRIKNNQSNINSFLNLSANSDYSTLVQTIENENQKNEKRSLLLSNSDVLSIAALGSQLVLNKQTNEAIMSINTSLLDGIINLDNEKIKKSKDLFTNNKSALNSEQIAQYDTLYNLIKDWSGVVNNSRFGNLNAVIKSNKILSKITKLDKIPNIVKNNLKVKLNNLDTTQTKDFVLIVLTALVFVITFFVWIIAFLFKIKRKKTQ